MQKKLYLCSKFLINNTMDHNLEFTLMALMFVLIGLMLVSFFLVWHWFDARKRLNIVREVTREQTIHAIRRSHNRCRWLLGIGLFLALCFIPIPFFHRKFHCLRHLVLASYLCFKENGASPRSHKENHGRVSRGFFL